MPLVAYTDIAHLLPISLRPKLAPTGDEPNAAFVAAEQSAAIIVRDKTGIEITDDTGDAPDWCLQPMAWLIAHIAKDNFSSISPDVSESIQTNYKAAMQLLREYKNVGATSAGRASTGTFTGGWN